MYTTVRDCQCHSEQGSFAMQVSFDTFRPSITVGLSPELQPSGPVLLVPIHPDPSTRDVVVRDQEHRKVARRKKRNRRRRPGIMQHHSSLSDLLPALYPPSSVVRPTKVSHVVSALRRSDAGQRTGKGRSLFQSDVVCDHVTIGLFIAEGTQPCRKQT